MLWTWVRGVTGEEGSSRRWGLHRMNSTGVTETGLNPQLLCGAWHCHLPNI